MHEPSQPVDLLGLTPVQMERFCAAAGVPAAAAGRLFAWVHRPGVRDPAAPGGLGREVRRALAGRAAVSRLEPARVETSRDGTVKFAFRLGDGAVIESVLIPSRGRHTLCVSSQVGCAMGCVFCRTAGMGFVRDLAPAEIVGQVAAAREHLLRAGLVRATPRQLVDNLVFMGMGEPLANYGSLVAALAILTDERGHGFSERRVTVSTCGVAPRIAQLGRDARVNLALSLHAADDAVRSRMMPVNRRWGVEEVLAACRAYPLERGRVLFVECVLIEGVNDAPRDARLLARRLRGLPCRVNLLPYNESPGLPFRRSPQERVDAFKRVLVGAGLRTLVRSSRGADVSAACGQLATACGERAACGAGPRVLLKSHRDAGRP